MKRKTRLIREQLEKNLRQFEPLRDLSPPVKGWIRAIRNALGMNVKHGCQAYTVDNKGTCISEV